MLLWLVFFSNGDDLFDDEPHNRYKDFHDNEYDRRRDADRDGDRYRDRDYDR